MEKKNNATRKLIYKIKQDKMQLEEVKASQKYVHECL
jgi:hypothetical protein